MDLAVLSFHVGTSVRCMICSECSQLGVQRAVV